jgi:hypothetical protein
MKRMSLWVYAITAVGLVTSIPFTAGGADDEGSPIYGVKIPGGYREWPVVSVAHEAGDVPDIRVILGNPVAMKAFREGTLPFPDGAIVARVAWKYVPSAENNAVFGRAQSFIAGAPTNIQFMIKDSKSYPNSLAVGVSPNLPTANLTAKRCTKRASPATSRRRRMI